MNLSKISDAEILNRLERLAKSERKITHLILWHVLEVETRKLFLKLGYESVYKYLTKHLGYSESAAYDRMQAVRVLKKVPEAAHKIEEGTLTLTQLVKVEQSLKQEKRLGNEVDKITTNALLEKIENKNTYDTEKIIACELNQTPRTQQKVRPQQDDSVRLEVTLTSEQYELLKKAQSLMSHVVVDNNLAEVIAYLSKNFIQKKEGRKHNKIQDESFSRGKVEISDEFNESGTEPKAVEKVSFKKSEIDSTSEVNTTQRFRVMPKQKRKHISLRVRRMVFAKAGHSCEHIHPNSNQRCSSTYQLQVDHIRPLAKGGSDELSNLRALCAVHNRNEAQRWGLC